MYDLDLVRPQVVGKAVLLREFCHVGGERGGRSSDLGFFLIGVDGGGSLIELFRVFLVALCQGRIPSPTM